MTWAKSIDLKTGRPVLDPTKQTGASKGNVKDICPSLEGGVSPASPGGVLAAHGTLLHLDQQHVHGLRRDPDAARPRHALHRRRLAVLRRPRWQPRRVHGVGCDHRQEGMGGSRSTSRPGAARSSRPATWRSTARSTDGSRRWTRRPASSFRSSRSARASSATRSRTAGRTASSTSRSTPASAATGSCSRATCASDDPADVRPPSDSVQGHRAAHQPGRHRLDLRALTERKKPCQLPDTSSRCSAVAVVAAAACKSAEVTRPRLTATGRRGRAGVPASERIPAGGIAPAATRSVLLARPSSTRTTAPPCSAR